MIQNSTQKADMVPICNQDWREATKSLEEKIKYIFTASFLTDLTVRIISEDIVDFKVHSIFLSMASAVFEAMITSNLKEGTSKIIEFSDVKPEIFALLLQHIYGHKVQFGTTEEAWELFTVAEKYFVYDLKDICLDHIKKSLNLTSVCLSLEMADRYNFSDLKDQSIKFIRNNTLDIVNDESFLKAEQKTVQLLLEQDMLNIKEIDLFKGIEKWIRSTANYQGEAALQALSNLLIPKFNFFNMTTKEFTEGPIQSKLIENNHMLAILANLSSANCNIPLPEGYMKNKLIRMNTLTTDLLCKEVRNICTDGGGHRVIFSTNANIRITAIKIFTQEGSSENQYDEEFTFKIKLDGEDDDDFWESLVLSRGKVNYGSNLVIYLSPPYQVIKGRKYQMGIYSKAGSYKMVKLDVKLDSKDTCFSFTKHQKTGPYLPLSSIFFTF